MTSKRILGTALKSTAFVGGAALASCAACAGLTWQRYGHMSSGDPEYADPLLDRFMPRYDIVERHKIRVGAPADVVFDAQMQTDLEQSRIVRGIFRAREIVFGAAPDPTERPRGLVEVTKTLGWKALAEIPNREIVMGAVTQPWLANPVFRGLPPEEFAAFNEPDFVKIIWTLRADPIGRDASIARTETRAVATDAGARAKFRRYWSCVSPGVVLIRALSLRLVKRDAERRVRDGRKEPAA